MQALVLSCSATSLVLADLMFASTADPFLCLGLNASSKLTLADCDSFGVLWQRNLSSASSLGLLQLQIPGQPCAGVHRSDGYASAFPALTNDTGVIIARATWSACQSSLQFRWNEETMALEVGQVGAGGRLGCLQRTSQEKGTDVRLVSCNRSADAWQQWLALPGGQEKANARLGEISFPLRTKGRRIIDANGTVVHLRGTNWYGSHLEQKVVNGLDRMPMKRIVKLVKHLGFNHVRLSYAVQMWVDHANGAEDKPEQFLLDANPDLYNLTVLEIFERVVETITSEGLLVVITAHTLDYKWCCTLNDENGLWWNSRVSETAWLESLQYLSKRFATNPRVIGYDLYNEVRPSHPEGNRNNRIYAFWDTAVWGSCTKLNLDVQGIAPISLGYLSKAGICMPQHAADWRIAATQAAYAVWHHNPDALVFIQGATHASDLARPYSSPPPFIQDCLKSKVVWSIHDYSWFKESAKVNDLLHTMDHSPAALDFQNLYSNLDRLYSREADPDNFETDWEAFMQLRRSHYTFMLEEDIGPVWIGEFGVGDRMKWWQNFVRLAKEFDMDWAHWGLVGIRTPRRFNGNGADVPDDMQILGPDLVSLQRPELMRDLILLQKPVLGKSVNISLEKECRFDPLLQPVVGTGEHPLGLKAYLGGRASCRSVRKPARLLAEPVDETRGTTNSTEEIDPHALAVRVANDAREARHDACKSGLNLGLVREKDANLAGSKALLARARAHAQQYIQAYASKPNPIHEALTRSKNQRDFVEEINKLAESAKSAVTMCSVIFSICTILVLFIMAVFGWRPSTHKVWRGPHEQFVHLCRTVSCNMRRWQPPQSLANARRNFRAWRIFMVCVYLLLVVAIVVSTAWSLQARALVIVGTQNLRCFIWSFAEGLMNGNDMFIGLLPTATVADRVMTGLENGSQFWESYDSLWEHVADLREQLHLFQDALDTLRVVPGKIGNSSNVSNFSKDINISSFVQLDRTGNASNSRAFMGNGSTNASCVFPAVEPSVVRAADDAWRWSSSQAVVMLEQQWYTLLPNLELKLREFRNMMPDTRRQLESIRDTAAEQFLSFRREDPLSVIESIAVGMLITTLLVVLMVFPALIVSSVVVTRFTQTTRCERSWCCCRFRKRSEEHDQQAQEGEKLPEEASLWDKEAWLRPRLTLAAWIALFLYGSIAVATGTCLGISAQAGVDFCAILHDLSPQRVGQYSQAFGFPTSIEGDREVSLSEIADMNIHEAVQVIGSTLMDCVKNVDRSFTGSFVRLETCATPDIELAKGKAEKLTFQAFLQTANQTIHERVNAFTEFTSKEGDFQNHTDIQALLAAVRAAPFSSVDSSLCTASGVNDTSFAGVDQPRSEKVEKARLESFCKVFKDNCERPGKQLPLGCVSSSQLLINRSCTEQASGNATDRIAELASAMARLFAVRASAIDRQFDAATGSALLDIWDNAYNDVLVDAAKLADAMNCKYIRSSLQRLTDTACDELVVAVLEIKNAMQLLGSLCIVLCAVLYILWLRTWQYVVKAREHREGSIRAQSGGCPPSPRALRYLWGDDRYCDVADEKTGIDVQDLSLQWANPDGPRVFPSTRHSL